MRGGEHIVYPLKSCTAYLGESTEREKKCQVQTFQIKQNKYSRAVKYYEVA